MRERARRVNVPTELRREIKHEQGCRCAVCGGTFKEKDLYIHHIKPVCHFRKSEREKMNDRENLVALCYPDHEWADDMALNKNIYLNELIDLEMGVEVTLRPRE